MMERNVSIIRDADGNKIVVINDILFKGKRKINWDDVKNYLTRYVGEFYMIAENEDIIYIGSDLHCPCMVMKEKLRGTMFFMHPY